MKLEHSFTVPVGVEQAWEVLLDIERVAPCMPGAVLDSIDGDNFTGRVKIKLGPVNLTYKGSASFVEKDEAARRVVLDANGKDARGNGTAAAKVTATLVGQGESTQVNVVTDLNITGKPAQFGRGVMVDVGNKLIGQFASCLEGKIGGEPEPEPPVAAPEPSIAKHAATDETPSEPPAPQPDGPAESSTPPPATTPDKPASSTPTPASAQAPASAPPAAPRPAQPARRPSAEPEPIDLLELAGGSLVTRLAPVAGGVVLLLLLLMLRRRRR